MTCIVGLIEDGKVYMGGDSAVTTYVVQSLALKKVFRLADCVIGCAGSLRILNLLAYAFSIPAQPEEVSVECYFTTLFVDALRALLKEAGSVTKQNEKEENLGYFLVGYQGRLFQISSDYSVMEVTDNFNTIGSGHEVALGALYATKDMSMQPQKRIELALQAASHFCSGVNGPFHVEVLEGGS